MSQTSRSSSEHFYDALEEVPKGVRAAVQIFEVRPPSARLPRCGCPCHGRLVNAAPVPAGVPQSTHAPRLISALQRSGVKQTHGPECCDSAAARGQAPLACLPWGTMLPPRARLTTKECCSGGEGRCDTEGGGVRPPAVQVAPRAVAAAAVPAGPPGLAAAATGGRRNQGSGDPPRARNRIPRYALPLTPNASPGTTSKPCRAARPFPPPDGA